MNEIRATHLVERAAMRLRNELGLSGAAVSRPGLAGTQPASVIPSALPLGPGAPPAGSAALPPAPAAASPMPEPPLASTHDPVSMAVLQRSGVALGTGQRTRVAEEFSIAAGALLRRLRAAQADTAAIPASRDGPFANLLLVTSAKPGEGKSFSALNLAATLAHNGLARVVLADVDPKPGSITTRLGLDGRPGLFDLAADAALRPEAVLASTAIRDLAVLPLGTRGAVETAQGVTRRIAAALERIARRCAGQVVILDASPCLATSEPSALAPMVGLVAMVVEAERTQREEVEHALELVGTCPSVMLLLNKIRGARGHAFGDYDYYGA